MCINSHDKPIVKLGCIDPYLKILCNETDRILIDELTDFPNHVGGKTVYRRHFQKADGRDLLLYGYAPHKEVPLAQDNSEVAKGGELRWHPLRREWNVYAPHRQNRTFKPSSADNPLAPSQACGAPTEIPFTDFECLLARACRKLA